MQAYEANNLVVGKTMEETEDFDWLGLYPVIDKNGVIVGVEDADNVPQNAVLVDWVNGKPEVVDGYHGFDAILE